MFACRPLLLGMPLSELSACQMSMSHDCIWLYLFNLGGQWLLEVGVLTSWLYRASELELQHLATPYSSEMHDPGRHFDRGRDNALCDAHYYDSLLPFSF